MDRSIGLLYLAYFVAAMAGTGLSSHGFHAAGTGIGLISYGLYAALVLLFYRLFKPVNAGVSLVGALLGLLGCALGAAAVFTPIAARDQLYFFSCYDIVIGYLIVRSTFLPNFVGAAMILAGFGWWIYLLPFTTRWQIALEGLGLLAEALLMVWLVVVGVNRPAASIGADSERRRL